MTEDQADDTPQLPDAHRTGLTPAPEEPELAPALAEKPAGLGAEQSEPELPPAQDDGPDPPLAAAGSQASDIDLSAAEGDTVDAAEHEDAAVRLDGAGAGHRPSFSLGHVSRFLPLVLLLLALIVYGGAQLRYLHSSDWDGGIRHHPDEYGLVGVVESLRVPRSFGDFMRATCPDPIPAGRPADGGAEPTYDSGCSTLNPRNFSRGRGFAYGSFPISLTRYMVERRAVGMGLPADAPHGDLIFTTGRGLAAFFDVVSIILVFLIGWRLYGSRVGLLAALLYAFAAFPIQQSHFFTSDAFAASFGLLTIFFAVLLAQASARPRAYVPLALLMGVGWGLAVACKITLVALGLVVGLAALQWAWRNRRPQERWLSVALSALLPLLLAGAMTKVSFHLANPDAFVSPSLLSLRIDPRFMESLVAVQGQVTGEANVAWGQQWTSRTPWVFPWVNMVLWGMGLGLGLAAWAGWLAAGWQLLRRNVGVHLLLVAWVGVFFYWQGGQWVKSIRYQMPIYGPLAVLAAWGLFQLLDWALARRAARASGASMAAPPALARATPPALPLLALAALPLVVGFTLLWGWGFSRIYARPNPRIAAIAWVKQNVPPGSIFVGGDYDEGLPSEHPISIPESISFHSNEDDPPSVRDMVDKLARADYLYFYSQRSYGSTARMPMRFPATNRFFEELFNNCNPGSGSACRVGYELVADFSSYPSLLGVQFNDVLAAEEAFSVYDHQRVLIYKRRPEFDATALYELITQDIPKQGFREALSDGTLLQNELWPEVYRLGQIPATNAPTALRLTQEQWTIQRSAGTWASIFGGFFAGLAPLWWVLLLEALGLATFGLLFRLRLPLPDRGLSLARPLGLVLVAFVGWALASARLLSFSRPLLALLTLALLVAGGLQLRSQQAELRQFLRERRGAVIASQLVYVLAFALFLLIRYLNPDLWHPAMGGERPMELAYTHAILKSSYFPPYDPWFAGGFMNYYYWGFLLVGTPMKLLGIAPEVGFNLAIPTVYGWTALGAFGVAYNLLAPLRAGLARLERRAMLAGCVAPIFLALLGNLAQVPLYVNGLREIGTPEVALLQEPYYKNGLWVDDAPAGIVGPALEGLRALTSSDPQVKQPMPFRPEWPYWNATRVVRDTINEFPFFSFLYGDLHAHVIALPLTLVALILCAGLLRSRLAPRDWPGRTAPWPLLRGFARGELTALRPQLALIVLLGLVLGVLRATNTWDYPSYLLLALASAGVLALRAGPWDTRLLRLGGMVGLLLVAATLGGLPWTASFANAYTQALNPPETAPLFEKLVARFGLILVTPGERMVARELAAIYGLWLFMLLSYAVVLTARLLRGRVPARAGRLAEGPYAVSSGIIADNEALELTAPRRPWPLELFPVAMGWLIVLAGGYYALTQASSLLLVSGLVALFAGLFACTLTGAVRRRHLGPTALALAGWAILAVTELVVVPGAGRMNTVFKFGYQVWTLLTLASALALPALLEALGLRRLMPPPGALPVRRLTLPLGLLWHAGLALLVAGALLYPLTAAPAKVVDRFSPDLPHTLDGSAFMLQATHGEAGQALQLAKDRRAMEWLRANVAGTPVVAEAHLEAYRWGSRIATWTGLPTVVGWTVHQEQQREAVSAREAVQSRIRALQDLYTVAVRDTTMGQLRNYGIEYIYLGELERAVYPPEANAAHFDTLVADGTLELVYNQEGVRIYHVVSPAPPLALHRAPNFTQPPDSDVEQGGLPIWARNVPPAPTLVAPPTPAFVDGNILALEEQYKLDPGGTAFALAGAYRDAGRIDDAIIVLQRGASINGGDVPIRHFLGDVLSAAGRLEEAEAAYLEAVKIEPSAGNITKVGEALFAWGELERAEERFREALGTDPSVPFAHYFLGEIALRREDPETARAEFKRFMELAEPGMPYYDQVTARLAELGG